jgi:hypothetical protein
LNGLVGGNLGVIKSMIAELTDETNVARGFSLMPMARAFGYIIGLGIFPVVVTLSLISWPGFSPFIGGVLSRPQDRWPDVFSHPFWAKYPYFLPCLVAAAYVLLALILSAIYLKEVHFLLFYDCNRAHI